VKARITSLQNFMGCSPAGTFDMNETSSLDFSAPSLATNFLNRGVGSHFNFRDTAPPDDFSAMNYVELISASRVDFFRNTSKGEIGRG
jgi:hypothetical protein